MYFEKTWSIAQVAASKNSTRAKKHPPGVFTRHFQILTGNIYLSHNLEMSRENTWWMFFCPR
jgi:hypothetical protein